MSRTVSRSCSATSLVVCSSQIARVLSRMASAARSARPAWSAMLRAVSQMVTSSAAATRTTAPPTSIHSRQAVHSSTLVMPILAPRALVEVVVAVAGPIDAPEAIVLARRAPRLLGAHLLPLRVEELDRPVGQRLRLHAGPAARNVLQDVPAVLAV